MTDNKNVGGGLYSLSALVYYFDYYIIMFILYMYVYLLLLGLCAE